MAEARDLVLRSHLMWLRGCLGAVMDELPWQIDAALEAEQEMRERLCEALSLLRVSEPGVKEDEWWSRAEALGVAES